MELYQLIHYQQELILLIQLIPQLRINHVFVDDLSLMLLALYNILILEYPQMLMVYIDNKRLRLRML